jgi:MFS family permease
MIGDNIEHVIGYWVIWELTHSPFWLGYAVVAHWLPFTLFSLYSGSLADRFSRRWLIELALGIYVFVSFGWGFLYLTGLLQIWHIAVLLVLHGIAGLIITPSSMLIIHEMVGKEKLVSAISINASLRPLAMTIGPAIGGVMMATVGPGWAFFANILVYFPLSVALLCLPYGDVPSKKESETGWSFILEGFVAVRQSSTIVAVLLVMAATSFLLGNAFHALVPVFADRLGASASGYSILLSAHGVGAILGGFLLGLIGSTTLRPIMVTAGALAWSFLLLIFALSNVYIVSLALLFMAGATQIIFVSMSQSIVQSWAPQALRGRVMGVYNFAALGTRVLSGFIIGSLATLIGTPQTVVLMAGFVALLILATSTAVRSLWRLELQELAPAAREAGVPVASG